MTDQSFCTLVDNTDLLLHDIATALNIDKGKAVAKFSDSKHMLVKPSGFEGKLYKVATFMQVAGSATLVAKTISMAKLAGVSELKIIQAQPFLITTLPIVGAMFFHGCGAIAENNTIGRTCTSIGNGLNMLMAYFELFYKTYGAPAIHKVTGIKITFNFTKQISRGPRLDRQEAIKIITSDKTRPIIEAVKDWAIKLLKIKKY